MAVRGVPPSEILRIHLIATIRFVTAERESLHGVLRQSQLFSDFSEQEVTRLAARMVRRPFSAGEMLFAEGDACRGLYIVVTGKVRIFKTSTGGREQVLAVENPGSTVAELPVFDGGAYPASAVAVEPTGLHFCRGGICTTTAWRIPKLR